MAEEAYLRPDRDEMTIGTDLPSRKPWPAEVIKYVEYRQEVAFREVGEKLGLGSDPDEVRKALWPVPPGHRKLTPEEFRDLNGWSFTPDEWCRIKADIEKDQLRVDAMHRSRFEDPSVIEPLLGALDTIQQNCGDHLRSEVDFTPYVATLPSGDVNARVSKDWSGQHTIMFLEQGLVRYLSDFAKIVTWVVPPLPLETLYDDRKIARLPTRYTMPPQSSQYLIGSLGSYAASGSPYLSHTTIPSANYNRKLALVVFRYMLEFVLVHEQAHLSLGHLQKSETDWEFEYEADLTAAALVTTLAAHQGAWAAAFWGCDLALVALKMLDQALAVLEFGAVGSEWVSPTHPSAEDRRKSLRGQVPNEIKPSTRLAAGHLLGMNDSLFDALWAMLVGSLFIMREQGYRASPLWHDRIQYSMRSRSLDS